MILGDGGRRFASGLGRWHDQMEERVKICPNCGTANDAKDRFCANCGAPLTSVPVSTRPPSGPPDDSPTREPGDEQLPAHAGAPPSGQPDEAPAPPSSRDTGTGASVATHPPFDKIGGGQGNAGEAGNQPSSPLSEQHPGAQGGYGNSQQAAGPYDQHAGHQPYGQYGQPGENPDHSGQAAQQPYDWQQQYSPVGGYGQQSPYGQQPPYGQHDPNAQWNQAQPTSQPWYESGQQSQPGQMMVAPPRSGRSTLKTVTLVALGVLLLLCVGTFVFAVTPYGSDRIERLGTWAANEQTQQANGN